MEKCASCRRMTRKRSWTNWTCLSVQHRRVLKEMTPSARCETVVTHQYQGAIPTENSKIRPATSSRLLNTTQSTLRSVKALRDKEDYPLRLLKSRCLTSRVFFGTTKSLGWKGPESSIGSNAFLRWFSPLWTTVISALGPQLFKVYSQSPSREKLEGRPGSAQPFTGHLDLFIK